MCEWTHGSVSIFYLLAQIQNPSCSLLNFPIFHAPIFIFKWTPNVLLVLSVKLFFKMIVVNYKTRFFTQIRFSVQICKSFQNSDIFKPLSLREERNFNLRSFVGFFFTSSVSFVSSYGKTHEHFPNPLRLSLRKRLKILVKIRTNLFNYRPTIFRQQSSNKTQLNMNSSNRIYTYSPRDLTTT